MIYRVTGELFFASSNDLVGQFDYAGDPDKVVIDLSAAHIWDASSVAALDAIETKYAKRGKTVDYENFLKLAQHSDSRSNQELNEIGWRRSARFC